MSSEERKMDMEYITLNEAPKELGKILCCECGVPIEPNPANMCVGCIRTKVDITEGIPKQGQLYFCKFCERYFQPPSAWISASLESKELLTICLKRLKGLNKVHLVDAGFIWTEPHSKRVKVKLTVQKEVMNGAILQQVVVVEFTVMPQMCDECRRAEAKDYWRAVVQVRQKVDHKKTMFYLEQLVLKHKAHINTTAIKQMHGGIDFFYANKADARKMVDFIQAMLPCRMQTAQELVTHDAHNNVYDYKHTFSIEIVPICKDDIVCLPKKLAQSLGNIGQLCLCYRVSGAVHLIDPTTGQVTEVSSNVFYRDPFETLAQARQFVEYTVMDVEECDMSVHLSTGHGQLSSKHMVAEAWVTKSVELGSGQQYCVRTHLGHLLKPGDTVLGFDLENANLNNAVFDRMRKESVPEVILVRKVYDKTIRARRRNWRLKRLNDAMETESLENDYNQFLEDLEEDPEYRKNINIYKDESKAAIPPVESDDEGETPHISLQEMLEDLQLDDEVMQDADAAE